MKTRLFFVLAISILAVSCSQYSCPAYSSHYSYSPPKQKAFKFKSNSTAKKVVKKAERD